MPTALDSFHRIVLDLIETVYEREQANLNAAARVMAGRLKEDGLIYVYGSGGHSALGAQEFFYRAGGLVPIYPMFDVNISVLAGAVRSTLIERTPGYARATLEYYGLGPGDVLIITSAYGVNAASVDAAIDGKKMGATVIAITSGDFAGDVALQQAARHPSGQHLADVADLMVDTHVPVGDAVAEVAGLETKWGRYRPSWCRTPSRRWPSAPPSCCWPKGSSRRSGSAPPCRTATRSTRVISTGTRAASSRYRGVPA